MQENGASPESWQFDWILEDLALGGALPRAGLARMHGIGAVIDARLENPGVAQEFADCGLAFLNLPTEDLCAPSQAMLDSGVAFARRAVAEHRKLLVHCQHGCGRAPLLALCILVDRGHAPLEALMLAKDARESVSPSPPQFEAWAEWLRRRGFREEVPSFDAFAAIAYRHLSRSG